MTPSPFKTGLRWQTHSRPVGRSLNATHLSPSGPETDYFKTMDLDNLQSPRHLSPASCSHPPEVPELVQTPSCRKGTPKVPKSQVKSGEMEPSNQSGEPPTRCKNSKNHDAALEHFPSAAEREARNLQNLFPIPHLLEKEEALEDDKELEIEVPLIQAGWGVETRMLCRLWLPGKLNPFHWFLGRLLPCNCLQVYQSIHDVALIMVLTADSRSSTSEEEKTTSVLCILSEISFPQLPYSFGERASSDHLPFKEIVAVATHTRIGEELQDFLRAHTRGRGNPITNVC